MRTSRRLQPTAGRFKQHNQEEAAVEWLLANWVWILLILAFIGMHMGHGHGGHGGRDEHRDGGGCH
jgi:hypothetical protein